MAKICSQDLNKYSLKLNTKFRIEYQNELILSLGINSKGHNGVYLINAKISKVLTIHVKYGGANEFKAFEEKPYNLYFTDISTYQ